MGVNLGMDYLLCQSINLLVDLLEVTVNLVLSNNVMIERLLLRSVSELFIIKHKLLCFGIMND